MPLGDEFLHALLERDLSGLPGIAQGAMALLEDDEDSPFSYLPVVGPRPATPMTEERAEPFLREFLGDCLIAERDYPELIMAGQASFDDARAAVLAQSPDLAAYPAALDRVLFGELFSYAPEMAAAWASDRIDLDQQAEILSDAFRFRGDPRASALQRMLEVMPEHDELESLRREWRRDVAEWQRLNGHPPEPDEP
jgi:hypothetical protein